MRAGPGHHCHGAALILLTWLSHRKLIHRLPSETWQTRLQNPHSCPGLIIHLPHPSMSASAFNKCSLVLSVILLTCLRKLPLPPACVEVGINTDVFMRDGPTPVSLKVGASLRWALVVRVFILSSSILKHNADLHAFNCHFCLTVILYKLVNVILSRCLLGGLRKHL